METPPPFDAALIGLLTPDMAALCREIGDAAMLALIEVFGGGRLYASQRSGGRLETEIGAAAAALVAAAHGGDTLTIPLCKTWRVHVLAKQGLSNAAIARRIGMHRVSVERIVSGRALARARAPNRRQGALDL